MGDDRKLSEYGFQLDIPRASLIAFKKRKIFRRERKTGQLLLTPHGERMKRSIQNDENRSKDK